jgi:hypothetical protein
LGAPDSLTTIQLWVATMPRQRTVRAEKMRTTAPVGRVRRETGKR